MINVRVFRATSEPDACIRYAEGYLQVLREFDIRHVNPMSLEWTSDPYAWVLAAEDAATGKMMAGGQIRLAAGTAPLPIELAIRELDERISDRIAAFGKNQTAELYGLWNGKEAEGLRLGNYYLPMAALAASESMKVKTLLSLCSPFTYDQYTRLGFEVMHTLGNNGSFFYPKKDLIALGMMVADCNSITSMAPAELELFRLLRENRSPKTEVMGRKGPVTLSFSLKVENHNINTI